MLKIKTITTTGGRPDALSLEKAHFVQEKLNVDLIPRNKQSLKKIAETHKANIIVAAKHRYEYIPFGATEPFFFHPSSAAFRIKRVVRGEKDTFIEAAQLQEGSTLLDCTLGLATDSMIAMEVVGESGRVVGCEANANVAFIVEQGLQNYDFEAEKLPQLSNMRKIEVVSMNAVDYLATLPDNHFDVVYLDPMFEETIEESVNFKPLRNAGVHDEVQSQWIEQAKRVARQRVVLKAHFRSPLFEQYQFERLLRPNTKFHFGVIELT